MQDASVALNALAAAFAARGCSVGVVGDRIPFSPLALDFKIARFDHRPSGDASIVQVVVEAVAHGDDRDGLRVNAIGYGGTMEDALRWAANQWLDGVVPVLHSWLDPHEAELGVAQAEFVVTGPDTHRRFGWRAHLGPVLMVKYGEAPAMPPSPGPHELYDAIAEAVGAVATHDTLFWIEAYVARSREGQVDATCLLCNDDWPDGEAALRTWAAGWPALSYGISKRQFLLFQSVPVAQLKARDVLTQRLEAEGPGTKPRRWWQRVFGA